MPSSPGTGITSGTYISAQLNGVIGGPGTYSFSQAQSSNSEPGYSFSIKTSYASSFVASWTAGVTTMMDLELSQLNPKLLPRRDDSDGKSCDHGGGEDWTLRNW